MVLARTLRRPGGQAVARTAGFNFVVVAASGLGGVILARTVGPTVRGDYAAVTAWFGMTLIIGGMGQPAALCFYVARDPLQAREYVATSRAIMLLTGMVTLTVGMLIAPLLAHGNSGVTTGYRIAFATTILAFVGASYTFSLQAKGHASVESCAPFSASTQPSSDGCVLAASPPQPGYCPCSPPSDDDAATLLRVPKLPPRRIGSRKSTGQASQATCRLWNGSDCRHGTGFARIYNWIS